MEKEYLKIVYLLAGLVVVSSVLLLHSFFSSDLEANYTVFDTPSVAFSTQDDYYRSLSLGENMPLCPSLPASSFLEMVRR